MQHSGHTRRTYYRYQKPNQVGPRACLLLVGIFFSIPGIILLSTDLSSTAGIVLLCVSGAFLLLCVVSICVYKAKQSQTPVPTNSGRVTVATTNVQHQAQQPYVVQQTENSNGTISLTQVYQAYGLPPVTLSYTEDGVLTARMGTPVAPTAEPPAPAQEFSAAPPSYHDAVKSEKVGEV